MMNYIKWEDDKLICTSPNVEKVWQTIADIRVYEADLPVFRSTTHIIFKDGTRKDFMDLKESFDEAEKYLQFI